MNQQIRKPKAFSIIVGVDYSEASAMAIKQAVRSAETHESSHIHVLHSVPATPSLTHGLGTPDLMMAAIAPGTVPPELLAQEMSHGLKSFVEKALSELGDADLTKQSTIVWTMHLRQSDPAQALVQLATDLEADLVVVGTHGGGWLSHFLLGSVAEGVVRRAPCPVLVVRPAGATSAAKEPHIEPLCPDCLSTRQATEGAVLWCERHLEHHNRAHTYHFTPFQDSHQSGELLHPLK